MRLFIIVAFFFLACSLTYPLFEPRIGKEKDDCVILLHGLGRTSRSMKKLEKSLSLQGYKVINLNYPSTRHPVEFLSEQILSKAVEQCQKQPPPRIHFVTHSLGGIIVRYYLSLHELPNLGRVVMLSPPNQGSELVDRLKKSFIYRKINGPAGQQLGTDRNSLPISLGPVNFELGVITGNRSFNLLSSMIIPGPDDGSVSVERAKVSGMKDFLVLPHSHTFIVKSRDAIGQVIYFLKYGIFKHETHGHGKHSSK
jgi:pimeloyl-ACP methyl ester carboxylesterase